MTAALRVAPLARDAFGSLLLLARQVRPTRHTQAAPQRIDEKHARGISRYAGTLSRCERVWTRPSAPRCRTRSDPFWARERTAIMNQIKLQKSCLIQRPVDVVRAHFLDFDHHIAHGVHAGVHYTVLARGPRQRVRSRFKVLGLPKEDELFVYADAAGTVVQEFVKGDFAGGTIKVHFEPDGPSRTRLRANFDVPARGLTRVLAPLVRRVLSKLADQAIEEDRRDLEEGGYAPRTEPAVAIA